MAGAARWIGLVALSIASTAALTALGISAALLIGPMLASIVLAGMGHPVRVAPALFMAAQAVIGIMISRVFSAALLAEAARQWPLFLLAVTSVLAAACLLGAALTRWRVLPGTAALWGAFPGAATTMVLMAADFGVDVRLVAFMQYFRVVLVALAASAVARIFAAPDAGAAPGRLAAMAAPVDVAALGATLAVAAVGAVAARRMRLPAGALLGPMVLGAVLHAVGWLKIELPQALLAAAYTMVGVAIGMRFDRTVLAAVARALPRVAASILALIGACAVMSLGLMRLAHVDGLTAYLAMSPGGADSVAIIAASAPQVDVPFVMALQVSRFLVILLFGPALAKWVARWAYPAPK